METIFQKDEKGNIVPLFLENINENDFKAFFEVIQKLDILNCVKFLNDFIIIIKKSIELGQIIIDFNDLFQKRDNGIIELIIEKYLFQEIKEIEQTSFKNFFIFISNNFQLGKNIYDFIYRIIGKMFRVPVILECNYELVFEKCIDLLKIFYENNEVNKENHQDVYFYFNNNEVKIELIKENELLISNFIIIDMYIYINEFYSNKNSNIIKINFSNNEDIEINLINNNIIQIKYKDQIVNNELLVINNNKWNNLEMKIEKDKILIKINDKNIKVNFNKEVDSINNLIFFSKFNGIISPIIISEIEYEKKENTFSKFFIGKLYKGEFKKRSKKQVKDTESILFEDKNIQDENKNENNQIEQYMNNIPLILFLK